MKTATAWKLSILFSSSAARTIRREGVECGQCIIFDQTTLSTDLAFFSIWIVFYGAWPGIV
jgi:hypothetical protein